MLKKKVLVTGGAGYIGPHTCLKLKEENYDVIICDNMVFGHHDFIEKLQLPCYQLDLLNVEEIDDIFKKHDFDAVIHFAAYTYVGESCTNPLKYYRNNVLGTLNLLESMLKHDIKTLVFSSTCATYGNPCYVPIDENHPQFPNNPYGKGKFFVESILQDFDKAYNFKSVSLRYFNAAGASASGEFGEDHNPETHLIPLILMSALDVGYPPIKIFGNDYPTKDGSCIRDYIHVEDLAQAHVLALKYLLQTNNSEAFNLGNGQGHSVKEVIQAAEKVTGQKIPYTIVSRRPGDTPKLISDSSKARKILGWLPKYPELDTIIQHAWNWHRQRHTTIKRTPNSKHSSQISV